MISVSVRLSRGTFALEAEFESAVPRLAILGPSGAGKTTLLDAIAGLRSPDSGRIEAAGTVLFDSARGIDLPPRRRGIGYVRQSPDLFPTMNVAENLAFARKRAHGNGPSLAEVSGAFGLGVLLARRPRELSGGQTRRVQMARAIVSAPSLLLLDEPLTHLDEASRAEVLPALARLRERFSIPSILVSHRTDDVEAFAQEAILVEGGRAAAGRAIDFPASLRNMERP